MEVILYQSMHRLSISCQYTVNGSCGLPYCLPSNKKIMVKAKRLKAFSLSELLVVLVIIGILVIVALPNLMPLISKSKATQAQQQFALVHTLQHSYFYTCSRYSEVLEDIGFEQQALVTEGGMANYVIEIVEADGLGFRARARAVVDFDRDGQFNEWEIDQDKRLVETVKD